MFLATLELFQGPLGLILHLFMFSSLVFYPFRNFKSTRSGILGKFELCHDLRGGFVLRHSALDFEGKLKLEWRELINKRIKPKWSLIVRVDTVVHDEEFTIWRVDCQSSHGVEISYINTFVECAIIQNDTASWSHAILSNDEIIIEYKSQSGITS